MNSSKLPISLCMIVKNEEHVIKECLSSIESLVSEIIIADTGCSDNTIQIAKSYNAQIFDFEWIDDFAAARNVTIAKAKYPWILILDADEVIANSDLQKFHQLIADPLVCTEFLQRHYTDDIRLSDFTPCTGEFPNLEKNYPGYFESNCVRLFPNHPKLRYSYRIHELVEPSIYELGIHKIVRTGVRIHHYGHTPEVKKLKKKGELYTPLGTKKISDQPKDWKAYFELGVELNVNGNKQDSAKAFSESVKLNPNYINTWINYGYVLMELKEFEQAKQALSNAIKLDPNSAESYCNLGVIGLRTNDLKLAETASVKAILLNKTYVNAMRNLASCYVAQNRFSEALMILKTAHQAVPGLKQIQDDIENLKSQLGILN
jgi:glycosyltransferase involved in cell wall biosynthesis